jgi:subfamily B ATP-binding cassette protein MsbA
VDAPTVSHRLQHRSTRELMGRLLRESVRPYAVWLVAAVFCMAVMAAATAVNAWLMKPVVNEVFIARNRDMLWLVGGAVLLSFVAKGVANYAQAMLMSRVGHRVIADNQNRLYAHLADLDVGFFSSQPTGALLTRFTVDINSMRVAVSNALTGMGKDFLSLVGLVVVMFIQDWQLALISFFVFPLAVYPIVRLGQRMRRVVANTQEETGLFTTLLQQTFQGIRVVKAYGMQEYEKGRVARLVERLFRLNLKAARTRALSSPIMETLGGAACVVVIVYGGFRVIQDQTDAGSFFSFITALLLAYEPLKKLASLNASLQEGLAGAERLFAMLDVKPRIADRPGAKPLRVERGQVRFEDVHFAYVPGKPALSGITLEVPAGKTAALVGPSGAGKTTIMNLIPRFYDVGSGRVLVDGTDVREATLASLRASVALVSQEITLFDDTVKANIAYGRAGATDEDVVAAARHAGAHDFVTALSEGYGTVVGERGMKLSGGERQRLAIARAMLKDAPILLLDEATSALDTESERRVQAALEALMHGRTTLVIAHRLSTVVGADIIYVIQAGRVVEKGTHAQLLREGGTYARLYALQFAEGAERAEPAPPRPAPERARA